MNTTRPTSPSKIDAHLFRPANCRSGVFQGNVDDHDHFQSLSANTPRAGLLYASPVSPRYTLATVRAQFLGLNYLENMIDEQVGMEPQDLPPPFDLEFLVPGCMEAKMTLKLSSIGCLRS